MTAFASYQTLIIPVAAALICAGLIVMLVGLAVVLGVVWAWQRAGAVR